MERLLSLLNTAVKSKTASAFSLSDSKDSKDSKSEEKFVSVLGDAFVALELDSEDMGKLNAKILLSEQTGKKMLGAEREIKELKNIKNTKDIKELLKLSDEKGLNLKSLIVEIKKASDSKKITIEKESEESIEKKEAGESSKPNLPAKNISPSKESAQEKKETKIDLKELIARNPQQKRDVKEKNSVKSLSEKIEPLKKSSDDAIQKTVRHEDRPAAKEEKIVLAKEQEETGKIKEQKSEAPLPKSLKNEKAPADEKAAEPQTKSAHKIKTPEKPSEAPVQKAVLSENATRSSRNDKSSEQIQQSQKIHESKHTNTVEKIDLLQEPEKIVDFEKRGERIEAKNSLEEKTPKSNLASLLGAKEKNQKIQPDTVEKNMSATSKPLQRTDTKPLPAEQQESRPEKKQEISKEFETKKTDIPAQKQNKPHAAAIAKEIASGKNESMRTLPQQPVQQQHQEASLMIKENVPPPHIKESLSLGTLLASKTVGTKNIKKPANESAKTQPTTAQAAFANPLSAENTLIPDKAIAVQILSQNISSAASQVISTDSGGNPDVLFRSSAVENSEEADLTIENGHEDSSNELLKSDDSKIQNLRNKIVAAKSTINHFSGALKEQIENYKAPIMKISMELNPKNLGSVEVTLLNRGKNLHVKINSNAQAINMFMQNNVDFKNSLNDLGYKDVELNFSSDPNQQENSNGQERENGRQEFLDTYKKQQTNKTDDEMEIIISNLIYG